MLHIALKAYILISDPKNYNKAGLNVINSLFFNKVLDVIKNENQLPYFNYVITDYNLFLDTHKVMLKTKKIKSNPNKKSSLIINKPNPKSNPNLILNSNLEDIYVHL